MALIDTLNNYNFNLTDRFPCISGKYSGNFVTYDRQTGWVWHDEDGGRVGAVSGAWVIRREWIEGDFFWCVYRNGRRLASVGSSVGWYTAVDIAAAIQGELDYEAADRQPRVALYEGEGDTLGHGWIVQLTLPLPVELTGRRVHVVVTESEELRLSPKPNSVTQAT